MRLIKLTLNNFKGVKNFTFSPEGQSADVLGRNESGKTTLYDAMTFLLTGKDHRDRSPDNFGIKTRENGEVKHGLNHTVTGTIVTSEGTEVQLSRTYTEKWTTKRGSAKEEFTGHTTDYKIDGVPHSATEYQQAIDDIIPEKLLKQLTMPDYVPEQMHWSDRRAILFDLAGDINDEDVIDSADGLERYPAVVGKRTHEGQEKVLSNQKKELNKEIDNIPDRMDEVNRMIEEVEGVELSKERIVELRSKKDTVEAKRAEVKSGGALADLKVQKQEQQAIKAKVQNEHQQSIQENLRGARTKIEERQDAVDEAESAFREAKRRYENIKSEVDDAREVVRTNKAALEEVRNREPKPESAFEPDTCPVCERPYEDAADHDYEQYLNEFNEQKAEDIKSATEKHDNAKEHHASLKEELQEAKHKAANLNGKLQQRKQALENAQQELHSLKQEQPDVSDTDIYKKIVGQIENTDRRIEEHKTEKAKQLEKLDQEIAALENDISSHEKKVHQAEQNEKHAARLAELEAQRKDVAEQLEQVEADLHLLEEFVRARSAYVTERVNEKFELVNWKLFEEQINGGLKETCTAVLKGVPFDEGLNTAGRIQAGVDIINTLSKHYNLEAPLWVDNAESVASLPDNDLQIIKLIHSPEHNELTVQPTEADALVAAE